MVEGGNEEEKATTVSFALHTDAVDILQSQSDMEISRQATWTQEYAIDIVKPACIDFQVYGKGKPAFQCTRYNAIR